MRTICQGFKSYLFVLVIFIQCNPAHSHEVRAAFSSECPTTNFPDAYGTSESPILVAVAASLASSLVDTGIAAAKKSVNPENKTVEGRFLEDGLYMYKNYPKEDRIVEAVRPANKIGCLVVAVGEFGLEGLAYETVMPFKSDRDNNDGNVRISNALQLNGRFKLAYYLEAARVFSGDKSAVTWKPVRFYVGEYLNESFWGGKERSALIQMNMYMPGKKEAFFSQEFTFDEIIKPISKDSNDLKSRLSGVWGVMPAAPAVPENFKATDDGHLFNPFTLEIRLVEAAKPYALAKAFVDAADQNKDAIKQEIVNKIDSEKGETAALTASGATLDSISGYLAAYQAALSACLADQKKDDAGMLNCSMLRDKALVARSKAELICKSNPVSTCGSLPQVPST